MPDTCQIVVVSYNSALELPACIESLLSQAGISPVLYVVDNASTDGSADLVEARFPGVHLIRAGENLGFARANNLVLSTLEAPYFALVNPDTVAPPDALSKTVHELASGPDVALVGPRIVFPDGTYQPSCFEFLGLASLLRETFGLDRIFPHAGRPYPLAPKGFRESQASSVDWLRGAFLVGRTRVCREVGVFDPEFFMYGEEMEWCYRIRAAGWRNRYFPGVTVVHVEGASSRPEAGRMFVENLKGRLRFLDKHQGAITRLLGRALIAGSVFLRLGWRMLRPAPPRGDAAREPALRKRQMFLAAAAWVLRGMPLDGDSARVR